MVYCFELFFVFVTSDGLLSTIFDCFPSLVINGSFLSIVSDAFLSLVTSNSFLCTIFVVLLSYLVNGSLLSAIFGGGFLFPVPPAGFQALFLPNTLSYIYCFSLLFLPLFYSFLPFLPILLAHHLILFIRIRVFNQIFIAQIPIASK